jgi:predicted carbohydrate-binding protein with CBM5 and CBM33 domain
MTGYLRGAAAVVTGTAAMLLTVSAASPAVAHGTLDHPASRTSACGTEGKSKRTAACKAALKAAGRSSMPDWDNLRVANVDGRDREVIPDGKLCSGGVAEFRGLDLARRDWPATTVRAGASYRFDYRVTIPHQGSFRLYVTKDGYDPAKRLAWSDLEREPFLTVREPAVRSGAYVLRGRLPAGKTGRHLIYTVWQNSDTPDTYYSCSDVVFRGAKASTTAKATPSAPSATGEDGVVAGDTTTRSAGAEAATELREQDASATQEAGSSWPLALAGLVALALAIGTVVIARRRSEQGREER